VQISTTNLLLSLNETQTVVKAPAGDAGANIAALTTGIRAGNENAFREFHRLYFDRIYQFLLVVARGNEDEARDALQETLLRVVRHVRKFDNEDAFWCWLKVVARNAARDAGRKQRRYLGLLQRFNSHSQTSTEPSTAFNHSPLGEFLEEGLAELTSQDRQIVEGKYLHGSTVRDLAAETGLTEKAVESRLLRLRLRIREFVLNKLRTP
jgi:RNA polymerase sigma-70 factor (ECF subfamily)